MNKKIIIISVILILIFSLGSASGTWYYMNQKNNQEETQLEEDKGRLESKITKLESKITELDKKIGEKENNEVTDNENSYIEPNYFDPAKVKVNDKIADMTIKEIKPFFEDRPSLPIGNENAIVSFGGEVTVKGEITFYNNPDDMMYSNICMFVYPWDSSKSKIPSVSKYIHYHSFCFEDKNSAKSLLGINEGETVIATVVIDSYIIKTCGCAAMNGATLKSVVNKERLIKY